MDKDRMLKLNEFLNEASYSSQQDYYDAQDTQRAVNAAANLVHDMLIQLETDGHHDDDIPSSINISTILSKQINIPKFRKEVEKQLKKGKK